MSLAEAIRHAAERVLAQGSAPDFVFVNARDFAALEEHQWSWEVEAEIDRLARTYQERTTLRSQMHAMWRLFSRRGRQFDASQFDARAWWKTKRAQ